MNLALPQPRQDQCYTEFQMTCLTDTASVQQVKNIRCVLIVDDHPLYSDAISRIVSNCLPACRIETASSMREAVGLLTKRFNPQIIFLDLNLPDVTGVSGFMSLQKRTCDVPIAVISATNNPEVVQLVHNSGAAGYIPKSIEKSQLETGVMTLLAGKRFFPTLPANAAPASETGSCGQTEDNNLHEISSKLSQLTPQQTRILRMICEGLLNKQIAYELDLAEATVKTHVTALMRKLGVQNRTQAALLVRDAMAAANLE